jgi:membrane protease YdiL (CAAX protease family)
LELTVGYTLILLAVWTPQPWQRLCYWSALSFLLLVLGLGSEDWHTLGLRLPASLRSLWLVGIALLVAGAAVALADKLHTLHLKGDPGSIVQHYWGYAIWAFGQEVLLMDFVLLRLLRLLRDSKTAVIAAAGLFALAHVPNPILTPATLIWGLVACLLFLHYRNVYTLAVMHAILGISIAATIPGPLNHNMRVGLGYLKYRPMPVPRQSSQNDHIVSTVAWVTADAPTRR